MQQIDFTKVICPACQRVMSHHLAGTESVYRNNCPRCGKTVLIYSAGKTALIDQEIFTRIDIVIRDS